MESRPIKMDRATCMPLVAVSKSTPRYDADGKIHFEISTEFQYPRRNAITGKLLATMPTGPIETRRIGIAAGPMLASQVETRKIGIAASPMLAGKVETRKMMMVATGAMLIGGSGGPSPPPLKSRTQITSQDYSAAAGSEN